MNITTENYRAYVYLEHLRGQQPTQIYNQLVNTSMHNIPSLPKIFRWCQQYSEGNRSTLMHEPRSGRPSTSTRAESIAKIKESLDNEPHQSLRQLSDSFGISKDSVRNILINHLRLRKVCSVWVPYNLSQRNKDDRMICANAIIDLIENNSSADLMKYWATEDETWVLFNSLSSKEENKAWLHPSAPKFRVTRPKLTNRKVMLLFAFTGDKKIYIELYNPGETVTSALYVAFIHSTGEHWRKL